MRELRTEIVRAYLAERGPTAGAGTSVPSLCTVNPIPASRSGYTSENQPVRPRKRRGATGTASLAIRLLCLANGRAGGWEMGDGEARLWEATAIETAGALVSLGVGELVSLLRRAVGSKVGGQDGTRIAG